MVLGCVVDAGFGFAARPGALGRWCGCVGVWVCVVRVGLLVPVG